MKNTDLASYFYDIAKAMEIENIRWKPKALNDAARSIEELDENIEEIYKKNGKDGLKKISGVGENIASHIIEYLKTKKISEYERILKRMPKGITELVKIRGIGPATIKKFMEEINIHDLESLEDALSKHKLRRLKGFSEKTEENLLQSIQEFKKSQQRMLLSNALKIADQMIDYLKKEANIKSITYAGSLRRMKDTIGDIDILAISEDDIMEKFTSNPLASRIIQKERQGAQSF